MNSRSLLFKLGYNTAVQLIGKVVSVLLGLLVVFVLTRYLGVSKYGEYVLVFSYLSFFSIIADCGLQLVVIKEIADKSLNLKKTIFNTFISLKILLVIISTIIAIFVLLFFPYSYHLKLLIVLGSLAVAISNFNTYFTTIFQSKIRLDMVTFADLVAKIITIGFILYFVYSGYSLFYIIGSVLLGNVASSLFSALFLKEFIIFRGFDKKIAINLLKIGMPVGITSFLSLAYFKIDTVMLSLFKSAYDVGVYSLAYKILDNIIIAWGLYMATLYPILSKYKSNNARFKKLVNNSFLLAILSSLVCVLVVVLFGKEVVNIFAGARFNNSIFVLQILVIAVPLLFINNIFYYIFLLKNSIKQIIIGMFLTLVMNILLNIVFIPSYSYMGAAVATIISEIILTGIYFYFYKFKGIQPGNVI